jgi:hypothetical protein
MGWDHGTYGWDAMDEKIRSLQRKGIPFTVEYGEAVLHRGWDQDGPPQKLRTVKYRNRKSVDMVFEEYLLVDDGDCDGRSVVRTIVYPAGKRPRLHTQVYDRGQLLWLYRVPADVTDFLYCINDGSWTRLDMR